MTEYIDRAPERQTVTQEAMDEIYDILNNISWEDAKKWGSKHYKTGTVEPVDLYRAAGEMRGFSIDNFIKYGFRNYEKNRERVERSDVNKIIHYALFLVALMNEGEA